jgi:tetratricopeptide (TPR) repeat protein
VHRARVSALTYLTFMLHDSSRPDMAREESLMREAACLARQLDDAVLIANCDLSLGELELGLGKTDEARSLVESALVTYERLAAPGGAGLSHDHLGWVAVAEHDYQSARAHFERAAEVASSYDKGQWLSMHALAALAPLNVLLGEREQGLRQAEEAVVAARAFSDRGALLMALTRTAEAAVLAGDYRRAGDALRELLVLVRDLGTRRWLADALELTALVLEWRAEPGAAVEILGASDALREGAGEAGGGVRAVAEAVERGRARLVVALGPDAFAAHAARGRRLRAEVAFAQSLARLEAPRAPAPNDDRC